MQKNARWLLTDVKSGKWTDELRLNSKTLGVKNSNVSVVKRTLRGGLCDGVDVVEVNNGAMSFVVLPTRGMGIWKGSYNGTRIGWDAPVIGPVHPKFVNLQDRGGLGWLAGFDEMMVRCGLDSNGSPCGDMPPGSSAKVDLSLHGRIANLPAHHVEVSMVPGNPAELRVSGIVDESALYCPQLRLSTVISTAVGSNAVTVADSITNMKAGTAEMELLYHCNFGPPVLEEGARMLMPVFETAPRDARAAEDIDTWSVYLGPKRKYAEQCYFHMPVGDSRGNSLALLENAARDKGIAVRFNIRQLPYFTQWKDTAAESDGYVTGLEPGTNFPNPKGFERRNERVIRLEQGQTYRSEISIVVYDGGAAVKKAESEIAAIQKGSNHKVFKQPQRNYSPA